jgi:methylornithine synthase
MRELETDQVRVMSFVPQPGTPLAGRPRPDPDQEVKIIAILRLLFPDRLIPASLDVFGLAGLRERLDAGANVITSLVPPGRGFAGVAQSVLDIDAARRTVASVEPVIRACGLTAATGGEYRRWVENRMEEIRGR